MLVQTFLPCSEPVQMQNVLPPWYVTFKSNWPLWYSLSAGRKIFLGVSRGVASVVESHRATNWSLKNLHCTQVVFTVFEIRQTRHEVKYRSAVGRMIKKWIWLSGAVSFHCSPGCTNIPNGLSLPPPVCVKKGTAVPVQAWTGPEGSRRLRLPDFKTIGTWRR